MNKVRNTLFGVILVISSSTVALGGEMQFPGRSNTPPPPPASAIASDSANDGLTPQAAPEEISILLQDLASTVLSLVLLPIY